MSTPDSPPGFLDAWARLIGPRGVPTVATRRGRKPRVPLTRILPALTFHVMEDAGTLAAHLFQLFRTPLADSSWSDRRLRLPWEIRAKPAMRRGLAIVVHPGFQLLDAAGPTAAFEIAERFRSGTYDLALLAPGGGEVESSSLSPSSQVDDRIVDSCTDDGSCVRSRVAISRAVA